MKKRIYRGMNKIISFDTGWGKHSGINKGMYNVISLKGGVEK